MSQHRSDSAKRELKLQFQILLSFVAILWLIEILDVVLFRNGLAQYGIRPHSLVGLRGILFAPFIHSDFAHLIANTVPLLTLGWLVMVKETEDFFIVTAITMMIGGLGTWIIASPNSVHIGASSLVFGYFGFLLLRGYFERSGAAIAIALVVFFLYGSMIWGVLPAQPGISWQGHLFGFIGGGLAAKLLAAPAPPRSLD